MANDLKGLAAHSAEYFGDARDHWWRPGFVTEMVRDWHAPAAPSVLDVGCGVGHWGRLLARALPGARFTGIDREPLWVEKAAEKAAAAGLADRFSYLRGTAESLPFDDATFDIATCQTVLMHLRDPARGLAEMARVTRPGGLVVAAEPTNVTGPLLESISLGDSPEVAASLLRLHLVCMRGKAALGEGNDLIGEQLPSLLSAAGLRDIEVRLNDRAMPMVPPYETPAERALVDDVLDAAERDMGIWSLADTRRYFLAGGGAEPDFEPLWTAAKERNRRLAAAVREGRYMSAGGMLFYVAWGRKPA